ncbi:MAG: Crp/Fnr family transcriptional regulator [Deltaproteobacteria bacterium]|nr:Crp/Fnr family transcriptional regulator [Deltaproteobacteria bacterium]
MPQRIDWLKRVSIFSDLDEPSLASLETLFKERTFEKEAVVVGQEDPGDSLYVLTEGRVKVVLFGPSGREVILSVFKPGEFFGEMSLLDNQPRSANVIALEPSKMLVLERSAFAKHLQAHPKTALNVLAEMSKRLRRADAIIGNLALLDVFGRVARFLRELAKTDGKEVNEGIEITKRPTQAEIAAMIGTSRETVSRALSEFQRRGFLDMTGKRIVLRHGFENERFND